MRKIVCLAGGVGGAKLAAGLAAILPPEQLTIIVNTGDDFEHLGLTVCPDLDTVMYTLGGVANRALGWGREGESWRTIEEVARLGGAGWFKLGDLDLATHLTRTERLRRGETLTAVTQHLFQRFGVKHPVLPMSDEAAPTLIESDEGTLAFQDWFVQKRWQPRVNKVVLPEMVRASAQVRRALETADAVLFAPSNPFVSIDPILNVYPIREMISDLITAVVAVSPIIGGQAVKGPAAKMMQELDLPVSARGVADYYGDLLDGFVYDEADEGLFEHAELPTLPTATWMKTDADRAALAEKMLNFAKQLSS